LLFIYYYFGIIYIALVWFSIINNFIDEGRINSTDAYETLPSYYSSDKIPENVNDTTIIAILDQLIRDKVISPEKWEHIFRIPTDLNIYIFARYCSGDRYRKRIEKLHEGILKSYRCEQNLIDKSNQLKNEIEDLKEEIKKSGIKSFEESTAIANYRKELSKVQKEIALRNEKEEQDKYSLVPFDLWTHMRVLGRRWWIKREWWNNWRKCSNWRERGK
jgi:hypothetical protein